MEEKQIQIEFNCGDIYKVPASYVAEKIVERKNPVQKLNRKELKRQVDELLKEENEMDFLGEIWDLPWSLLCQRAVRVNGFNLIDEWQNGRATVGVKE